MSRQSGNCVRCCLVVFAVVSAVCVSGPTIYGKFKKSLSFKTATAPNNNILALLVFVIVPLLFLFSRLLLMTAEEVKGNSDGGDGNYGNFPVGMKVLAVDDDPICLKLLEVLLRKCQYHVTTTNQARVALKVLRENRDIFDLVISTVHMPDMDGFKPLELVGLEMDLPVIMLSANSEPKLVMKGVSHGTCEYLVQPVRIEELRNIWQHVIRRKKFDSKKQSKSAYEDKALQGNGEVCQGPHRTGNSDQSGKLNKKRKDEEDESEDNRQEHEDPATQKKPCVVWSFELHGKFVAAVNQLGIERGCSSINVLSCVHVSCRFSNLFSFSISWMQKLF
ncbi:hypothetical protein ACH5RR_003523 [Cinchona calisaya]|uniref:Response regulatory domain-containing protein n=1 Tax=Cinchona calisaya TaxID=153742 RepID=A0ABD3AVS6_9GENT